MKYKVDDCYYVVYFECPTCGQTLERGMDDFNVAVQSEDPMYYDMMCDYCNSDLLVPEPEN